MEEVIVELAAEADRVVLQVLAPSGDGFVMDMTADQARDLSNMLGATIKAATRTGVRT